MKRIAFVVGVVALVACDRKPTDPADTDTVPTGPVDAAPVRFARTFSVVQCMTQIGANNAPCVTYVAASHTDWLDSGRVSFSADNTAQWKLATHVYQCPCYLGGCTTPCSHGAPQVSEHAGTYSIAGDSIKIQFNQGAGTKTLVGKLPSTVPANWAGPDSLRCLGCSVFYPVLFRSQ
jgi:hypothetical protein